MRVYLVRHAKAGDRSHWDGDDRLRPLSRRGHAQAAALVEVLADATFSHIVSSPYVRCLETVVPLAATRGLTIESAESLAEGVELDAPLAVLHKYAEAGAVLCSHGDVIPMLLEHIAREGVDVGADPVWPKGSVWVLDVEGDRVLGATYVSPP